MQPMDFSGPAMFGEGELSVNIPLQANFDVDAGQAYSGDTTYADMGFSAAEIQGYIDDEKYIGKYGTLPPDMFTSMSRERTATIADTVSQSTEPGVTVLFHLQHHHKKNHNSKLLLLVEQLLEVLHHHSLLVTPITFTL